MENTQGVKGSRGQLYVVNKYTTGALNTAPEIQKLWVTCRGISHWELVRKRKIFSSWRNVDSDEAALTEEVILRSWCNHW